jgi:hypothetical protein
MPLHQQDPSIGEKGGERERKGEKERKFHRDSLSSREILSRCRNSVHFLQSIFSPKRRESLYF